MKDPFNKPSFETTRWSVVVSAGQDDSKLARDAMEQLCRRYWFPLFAFIRRRGYGECDAEDLVQAFFVRVVEKDVFAAADQDRGRFRTFLLTSLENFLSNEYAKATALRRGGGNPRLSLDLRNADGQRSHWIADGGRAEDEYHRQWAIAALDAALKSVQTEYEREGNATLFSELRPYLSTDGERKPYALVAEALGISPTNVKVAVHRLRKRYRRQLESEIASTVESPEHIEDEIRQLFQALGG
ncbi:RNA polymerase sigma factor [Planctomycetes bacterium TBK1r]|uniref:RNA polymerase sigma factor n=1 Tax=Stieleria magnilauensis TaxID=2527963 RepID=A0ABX5XQN3_9BACT|nr:RNA polymerase sigma factor [Planctomycetes bacterium TBK1r]